MPERFRGLVPDSKNRDDKKESVRQKYEKVIWAKADELSEERTRLSANTEKLFEEVKVLREKRGHPDDIREKQAAYWVAMKEIEAIKEVEEELQEILVQLENGVIDEASLKDLLPDISGESGKLSKRKQRIQEERARMEEAGEKFVMELPSFGLKSRGPQTRHLTTGRRATGIKGNFDSLSAEGIFNDKAADTHGGKTREFGKKAGHYMGKSGRKIRKR